MTREQVEEFQRCHLNHLGEPLRVDGVLGPQTEWAMDLETLCLERRNAIRRAQTYLDLEEVPPGSNADPAGTILSWQRRCNAPAGSAWCGAFASYCIDFRVSIAGAQAFGRYFPATTIPFAGDYVWWPTVGWQGHIELIIGVWAFELMTIGGNITNRVRCVRRQRKPFMKFARVYEDTSGTCPGVIHTDRRVPILPVSAPTR